MSHLEVRRNLCLNDAGSAGCAHVPVIVAALKLVLDARGNDAVGWLQCYWDVLSRC